MKGTELAALVGSDGVAAAGAVREDILLAGIAGMVAGALSMAAGEYVSVSSQADTERSDLALERSELAADQPAEERELAAIYVQRGLEPALARIGDWPWQSGRCVCEALASCLRVPWRCSLA